MIPCDTCKHLETKTNLLWCKKIGSPMLNGQKGLNMSKRCGESNPDKIQGEL